MGWTDDMGRYHTDDEPQPGGMSNPNAQLPSQIMPADKIIPRQEGANIAAAEMPRPIPMPVPAPAIPPDVSVSPSPTPTGAGQMQTTGSSTTVASGKLSSESKGVLEDRKRLTDAAVETEKRLGQVQGQQAEARVAGLDDLVKVEQDFGAQQQKIIADSQKRIEQKRAEVDKAVEERKKAKFTDFFEREGGDKFQTQAAILLGGLGAAFSARGGGSSENKALTTLFQLAERDTKNQERKIAQLDSNILMARTGVRDEEEAKASMLADVHINKAAAMGKTARMLERNLAQTGKDEAEIAADQRVVALRAQENSYLQQAYAITNKQVQSTTTKQIKDVSQQAGVKYFEGVQGVIKDDPEYKRFNESSAKAKGYEELDASLQQAIKDKNPTAINATIRLVAQQINGGVLSDGEGKQLIEQAGGVWDSANNKVAKFVTGAPAPETIKNFSGTIRNLRAQSEQTAAQARNGVIQRWGQQIPVQALNVVMPGGPAQQPAAPAANTQAAVSWLQANPNHPRAAAVAEKLRAAGVKI